MRLLRIRVVRIAVSVSRLDCTSPDPMSYGRLRLVFNLWISIGSEIMPQLRQLMWNVVGERGKSICDDLILARFSVRVDICKSV